MKKLFLSAVIISALTAISNGAEQILSPTKIALDVEIGIRGY